MSEGVAPREGAAPNHPLPGPTSVRSARELLLWALRRRRRFRIRGTSMAPGLLDDDQVLVDPRAYRRRAPRVGEVVLLRHPFKSDVQMVKRVQKVLADGRVDVRGDDPAHSTDSRVFGAVPLRHVVGRVVLRLP